MTIQELASIWKKKATESRQEAVRIRGTIKSPTDAEERCWVRAEVWDKCSNELASYFCDMDLDDPLDGLADDE